jgi:hypothetical protein
MLRIHLVVTVNGHDPTGTGATPRPLRILVTCSECHRVLDEVERRTELGTPPREMTTRIKMQLLAERNSDMLKLKWIEHIMAHTADGVQVQEEGWEYRL